MHISNILLEEQLLTLLNLHNGIFNIFLSSDQCNPSLSLFILKCILNKHLCVPCVLSCLTAGVCHASGAGGMWCELHDLSVCPDTCSYCCLRGSSSVLALAAAGRSWYKQTGKTALLWAYGRDTFLKASMWNFFIYLWKWTILKLCEKTKQEVF